MAAAAMLPAFVPGQAAPDTSGCWSGEDFTFEKCCVPWSEAVIGVGTESCWSQGYSYERCCLPYEQPRDFFGCSDRGSLWQRFLRDMMLGRDFSRTQLGLVMQRHVSECLLGGLIGTLAHLAMLASQVSSGRVSEEHAETTYQQADQILGIVLHAPLSMDELLLSGWPVGGLLTTLRQVPWLRDRAMAAAGHSTPLDSKELRLCAAVTHAMAIGHSPPLDVILAFLAGSPDSAHPEAVTTAFWAAAYALQAYHLPRAVHSERASMAQEVQRLLRLGDRRLRAHVLAPAAGGPLAMLLAAHGPVVELMQVLQWNPVVVVDPLSVLEDGLHFDGLSPALIQRPACEPMSSASWLPRRAPPLELHVLPRYDSVSNQVRASRLPFCYEKAFLLLMAEVAAQRWAAQNSTGTASSSRRRCDRGLGPWRCSRPDRHPARPLQLWEVGANLGDCTLWAASMLLAVEGAAAPQAAAAAAARRRSPAQLLRATAFEPMPGVARAMRRAAAAMEEAHPLRVEIRVRQMALADKAGRRELGVPSGSFAEATFQDCMVHYGAIPGGCNFLTVRSETSDRLLLETGESEGRVLDLIKVHVQGDELLVLRGARRALARGRICVVMLKVSSSALGPWEAGELAEELHGLLRGFSGVLVATNGTAAPLGPPGVLAGVIDGTRRKEFPPGWKPYDHLGRGTANPLDRQLLAWRSGPSHCRRSPVAVAAKALWGMAATPIGA